MEEIQVEYQGLVKEFCSAVKDHFKKRLVAICIFGSVSRGEAAPESDIDALIVAEDMPQNIGGRIRETAHIHEDLKATQPYLSLRSSGRCATISTVYLTPSETERHPPILLDLVDEGKILHDRDNFLAKELESIRKRLDELGSRRVITKGGHYWILKPDIKPGEVFEI